MPRLQKQTIVVVLGRMLLLSLCMTSMLFSIKAEKALQKRSLIEFQNSHVPAVAEMNAACN